MKYLFAVALFSCSSSVKAEIDVSTLYDISMADSTRQMRVADEGRVVIAIRTNAGAHVSDEAPLKIELSSDELKLKKSTLALTDSVVPVGANAKGSGPRFEVPFRATRAGQSKVDAKMTFFICTEKLCVKQSKTLSIPVEVN